MRIRSIKPEFWRSDDIAALPIEDRLLFVGLWSYVDDSGIGVDKIAHICADLFAPDLETDPPGVFARVTGGLQSLAERGLILRYEADGKPYLYVTNWEKHQRIDKPSKRRYPTPDQGVPRNPGGLQEDSRSVPENGAPGAVEQRSSGTEEQKSPPKARTKPIRPEVEELCQMLSDRIKANGAKRHGNVTDEWRDEARLMLDKDGYTFEQIAWMINWSQSHHFWRTNVLSMPKLRERFDQMKLQATSDNRPQVSKTQREIDEWLSKPTTPTLLEVTQ